MKGQQPMQVADSTVRRMLRQIVIFPNNIQYTPSAPKIVGDLGHVQHRTLSYGFSSTKHTQDTLKYIVLD
jgi:hypothetical protein